MTTRRTIAAAFETYRTWPVLLVLMAGAFVVSGGIFIRPSNLLGILFIATPIAIAAMGQTLVIMTAGIDLSVASIWALSAAVAAGLAADGWSLSVSVLAALGIGLAAGLFNGVMVAILRVPPLIATLGTLSIDEGIARVYLHNSPILSVPTAYRALGSAYLGPIPLPTIILLTTTLLLIFVMHRMAIGKQIYAVGGNPVAARYAGLPVARTILFVYVMSGLLAGLAGLLHSAYVQEATGNLDMATLFATIGSVVVAGTSLAGGSGRIVNTVGGVLVIVVIENMMSILGVSPLLEQGVLGFVVLVAVYLNVGFRPEVIMSWMGRAPSSPPARPA